MLKLTCYYYGIIMCNAKYLLIDTVTVMTLTGTMALCQPLTALAPRRPPASLLGPATASSVLCAQLCNTAFFVLNLCLMAADDGYVRWPAHLSPAASWWLLGDNWEATTIFVSVYVPFLASAAAFSIGGAFRRPLPRNIALSAALLGLYLFTTLLLLLPPSAASRVFHIASDQFNSPCAAHCYPTDAPVTLAGFDFSRAGCETCPANPVWLAYQQPLPWGGGGAASPAMGLALRMRLWCLTMLNCTLIVLWEGGVLVGPGGRRLAAWRAGRKRRAKRDDKVKMLKGQESSSAREGEAV